MDVNVEYRNRAVFEHNFGSLASPWYEFVGSGGADGVFEEGVLVYEGNAAKSWVVRGVGVGNGVRVPEFMFKGVPFLFSAMSFLECNNVVSLN